MDILLKRISKAAVLLFLCIPLHVSGAYISNDEVAPISDDQITAEITKLYSEIPDLDFYGIKVTTVDGVVYLAATVRVYAQKYRAIEIAQGVDGVKSVDADKLYFFENP